jgi:hypothetical protein
MKKVQTHLKYGGLTGLAMVILSLLVYVIDGNVQSKLGYVIYVAFIVGIIMNAMAYSKANNQYVSFSGVFSSCFKASAIIALCMLGWSLLSLVIFPEMKEKGMQIAMDEMSKNPQMTDEMIDQWMVRMDKYYGIITGGFIMAGMMFWGAIISLIGAAVAKKKGEGMPQA